MLAIDYRMKNEVNGTKVQIEGSGTLSQNGEMALNLAISERPKKWGPIILPCICSGPGPGPIEPNESAAGLIHHAPRGYRTAPGTLRRATLFDSNHRVIASVSATGVYALKRNALNFDIDVKTSTSETDLLERLTSIDHYSFSISPESPGRVLVYSHYSLSTSAGEKVHGFTQIHYEIIGSKKLLSGDLVGYNRIVLQETGNFVQYISVQRVKVALELGMPRRSRNSVR
jgi:hypothetical protein